VPEGPLHGDDVAAGGDEPGGVEVPEVVQSTRRDAGGRDGDAPAIADSVLVRGLSRFSGEEPSTTRAERGDVRRQDVDKPRGQEDDPLAAVLGRPQLDPASAASLPLAGDGECASQEVDVPNLQSGGLAKPETGEGADRYERAKGA
jgi:hypothetical protein